MALNLKLTPRASLQLRGLSKFPAHVVGGEGIDVETSGDTITISSNLEATIPNFTGDVTNVDMGSVLSISAGSVTGAMIQSGAVDLASKVTGTLPLDHGGTGANNAATALAVLGAVPLAGGSMSGDLILANTTPPTNLSAASKQYVDSLAAGLSVKTSVVAATTGNASLTVAFENGDTLDGVTLATDDRILIKNQTASAENGIYKVKASGAPDRVTDLDTWAEAIGALTFVTGGSTNAATGWAAQATPGGTINSTSLPWAQYSANTAYTADETSVHLAGTVFSIPTGGVTNAKIATATVAASRLVGSDIATVGTITSGVWNGTTIASAKGGTGQDFSASTGFPLYTSGTATIIGSSGTGNVARVTSPTMSSPTVTGTLAAAAITASGNVSASGNVGVGTASPSAHLHVVSNAPDLTAMFQNTSASINDIQFISNRGSGNFGTFLDFADIGSGGAHSTLSTIASGGFRFSIAGTDVAQMNVAGVGVGTTNPATALNIAPFSVADTVVRIDAYSGLYSAVDFFSIGNNVISSVRSRTAVDNQSGVLVFDTALSGALSERMRIDTAGNVGIGTTAPTHKLEVVGTASISGTITAGSNVVATGSLYGSNAYLMGGTPWTDVRAWGALGDGSTNDHTAIQNAIDYMNATYGGGTVFFPPGNYHTASTIHVPGSVNQTGAITLVGCGRRVTYITASTDITVIQLGDIDSNGYCGFHSMSIYGYTNAAATSSCVLVYDNIPVTCRDAQIWGGLWALENRGTDGTFDNCFISGWGTSGGHILSSGANWYIRCKIDTADNTNLITYAFFQQTPFVSAAMENHFTQCDFTGDHTYSVYIDDNNTDTSVAIFDACVFANPILIQSAKWTCLSACELGSGGSFAVNNTHGGHVTVANSYAFGATTIIGGSSNLHLSNNVNIS